MTGKTRPEGYEVVQNLEEAPKYRASAPFVTSISVILGVIMAVGLIVGVIGDAFYVTRHEYTDKNLKDIEVTTNFQSTLNQLKETMTLQAANFKEMTACMDQIRLDLASRKK